MPGGGGAPSDQRPLTQSGEDVRARKKDRALFVLRCVLVLVDDCNFGEHRAKRLDGEQLVFKSLLGRN